MNNLEISKRRTDFFIADSNFGMYKEDLNTCKALAKEQEKAVPVMAQAAELSDDGELDAQLAQIYLNMEDWDNAISAAEKAIEKVAKEA